MPVKHLNVSYVLYHIEKLTDLLNHSLTINFKIIGVTEKRFRQNKTSLSSIDLPNYNIEHKPTKSDKWGALPYMSEEPNYKARNSLQIHKEKELESIFAEVSTKHHETIIEGLSINTQIW